MPVETVTIVHVVLSLGIRIAGPPAEVTEFRKRSAPGFFDDLGHLTIERLDRVEKGTLSSQRRHHAHAIIG